jgi:AcrR family transcriptional regulator
MARTPQTESPARERILAVASDLFYRNGYRATGINELIAKSDVAKATFYSHFATKDELCLAYLSELSRQEEGVIERAIAAAKDPAGRLLAVIQALEPWSKATDFRGCAFLNIASEVPDPRSPLRKVGQELYEGIGRRVATLAEELIASDRKKYSALDAKRLAEEYMILFTGCAALVGLYHDVRPVRQAVAAARSLLEAD